MLSEMNWDSESSKVKRAIARALLNGKAKVNIENAGSMDTLYIIAEMWKGPDFDGKELKKEFIAKELQ